MHPLSSLETQGPWKSLQNPKHEFQGAVFIVYFGDGEWFFLKWDDWQTEIIPRLLESGHAPAVLDENLSAQKHMIFFLYWGVVWQPHRKRTISFSSTVQPWIKISLPIMHKEDSAVSRYLAIAIQSHATPPIAHYTEDTRIKRKPPSLAEALAATGRLWGGGGTEVTAKIGTWTCLRKGSEIAFWEGSVTQSAQS